MFETVAPEAFAKRSRFALYESLPISIAIHVAVFGLGAWHVLSRVTFPKQPPFLYAAYASVTEPPPPPPAAAKAAAAQQPPAKPEVPPAEVVAPTVIPDTIPVLRPATNVSLASLVPSLSPSNAVAGGVDGAGTGAGGDGNGVAGGVIGGVAHPQPRNILGGLLLEDGRVHFARDVLLPIPLEAQVAPEYPEKSRLNRHEDDVLVRYIIGKDGRVKQVMILQHAEDALFDKAALDALWTWRFRPLMVDGEPREVVHDLLIRFRLE